MAKPEKEKPALRVPVRPDGSLLPWADGWSEDTPTNRRHAGNAPCGLAYFESMAWSWRDNFEFEDTLVYQGYAGGRSAMSMTFTSATTGATYPMFWTDFEALIRLGCPPGPTFAGRWTFRKRGQNYGVRPA